MYRNGILSFFVAEHSGDIFTDSCLEFFFRPFADDPRKLFKIGVRFSTDSHRIDDWKVVE